MPTLPDPERTYVTLPARTVYCRQQLSISAEQMSAMMRSGIPFSNAPGVEYEYSNYGFAILGRIVSVVSGMPYNRFLETQILRLREQLLNADVR